MTAINHALTGALIGLTVRHPFLAGGIALLSHFVLDALPHFTDEKLKIASKKYNQYLFFDALLCVTLVLVLVIMRPLSWQLASLCAFLATTPDFMWAPAYLRARKGKKFIIPDYSLARLHAKIQWFAKPIGAFTEILWFSGMVLLVVAAG